LDSHLGGILLKVLVLGGTGLISQSIVGQLVARGDEVHVYNRGVTVADLPADVGRIHGERSQVASLRDEINARRFDCVIDMCGYTESDAQSLILAVGGVVPQVLFCSTTDVFVKGPGPYPITERSPRGASPSFPYAVGKVASEALLEKAAGDKAFALTIIRPAQTYGGPNHGPNHPLGHRGYHLLRLSGGLPLVLHGDASSLWCACFAPDVAAAFVAATGNELAYNRAYNAAGDEVVTWRRYWEIAADAFGSPPLDAVTIPTAVLERVFKEDAFVLVENYQYNNVFDCSRAKEELGFRYRTTLLEGFTYVAKEFGETWLRDGEHEQGSAFATTYDKCLNWWESATAIPRVDE
jgi:nucleoside-diphosphate-sugar epimerase